MADPTSGADPVQRLARALDERPRLLLERWERRVADDPRLLEARRSAVPALHEEMPALVGRLAAQLGTYGCAASAQPDWVMAREDAHTRYDLPVALGELAHLRAALLELCAALGVGLGGEALLFVEAQVDEAMMAVAAALARGAIAAARRERERLDLTLRLLPVGVFISDAGGRILAMNDAARRIWGAGAPLAGSAEEYDVYRAYRPGATEPIASGEWGLSRALRGEEPLDEDVEIVSYDGDRRMILNSAMALRDTDGTITGGVAVNVDVTERKRTELCLAAIIEGALEAIVLIDRAGRVTEWNSAAERTFGYPRSEAIGRELAELIIEPGLRDAHRRGLQRCLATGESGFLGRRVEMRAMRSDRTLFDSELTVIRLPAIASSAFAGFVRDISERRSAELERAREAEFRERFIGILGHDLRTPLTAVSFTAHALHGHGGLSEAARSGLQRILRSADRMDRMIRDLLDLTRTRQGGGMQISPRAVDLSALCRQVLDEVELAHPRRAVAFHPRCAGDGQWDPDRLAQLIQNLVNNALDYSPADTQVVVAIDCADERVALSVKNEGPPIPAELLPHLFDPFRRGRHPDNDCTARGLGLGLYIAREIVLAHHGRMGVESDPARGTTFRVELPRSAA